MNRIKIKCTEKQLDIIVSALSEKVSEDCLTKYLGYKRPDDLHPFDPTISIEAVKDCFEIEKPVRWRAGLHETYFSIGYDGCISANAEEFVSFNNKCYESGNYFKTFEEAKAYSDKFKKILEKGL